MNGSGIVAALHFCSVAQLGVLAGIKYTHSLIAISAVMAQLLPIHTMNACYH